MKLAQAQNFCFEVLPNPLRFFVCFSHYRNVSYVSVKPKLEKSCFLWRETAHRWGFAHAFPTWNFVPSWFWIGGLCSCHWSHAPQHARVRLGAFQWLLRCRGSAYHAISICYQYYGHILNPTWRWDVKRYMFHEFFRFFRWHLALASFRSRTLFGSNRQDAAWCDSPWLGACDPLLCHPTGSKKTLDLMRCTPPKFNMEPENNGFQTDFPFPGTYFRVPC